MFMKKVHIKRAIASALVLALCLSLLPAVGLSAKAESVDLELLTSKAKLEQADATVLSYDPAAKTGWIGGNGTTASDTLKKAYFSYPVLDNKVVVDGVAMPITDCEVVYRVTVSDLMATTDHVRGRSVNLMLRYTKDGHTYELENRFGAQIYSTGHFMQIYVDGAGKNDSTSAVAGTPFYADANRAFGNVPVLKDGDTIEMRIKCASDTEDGYIKLSLSGSQIGEFTYTGTALPEFGLGSMKLMAKISNISIAVAGASDWATCIDGHTSGEWIVDKAETLREEGSRHTECTKCGKVLETETIPAIGGLELLTAEGKLQNPHGPSLTYDTATKTGWIGGDGTTQDNSNAAKRYFTFPKVDPVYLGDQAVSLDDCEISYLVNVSEANITGNVRGNAVVLMLKTSNDDMLELRFGAQIYGSGHYMQNIINNVGKGNVNKANGSAFYTDDSSISNNFPNTPSLKETDTIELRVKCATETENGYVKMYVGGQYIGQLVYTGKTLPEFGLSSYKLMAKLSDISIMAVGASATPDCSQGHTPSGWIVDKEDTLREDGSRHKECVWCHEVLETEIIPAIGGLELLTAEGKLQNPHASSLTYDTATKTGWIGGDGTTQDNNNAAKRYFTFPKFENVYVDGESVSLDSCEISYLVNISEANITGEVRSNAVVLMLKTTDADMLELRFGAPSYGSGHYMQNIISNAGKGSVYQSNGSAFYAEDSTIKNNFPETPALKETDTIELRVKCATETENGYVKMYVGGQYIGELVYTGTTLPQFGLSSYKLMAKLSDISIMAVGAEKWVPCSNGHTVGDWIVERVATGRVEGYKYKVCSVCGEKAEEEYQPVIAGLELIDEKAYFHVTEGNDASDRVSYNTQTMTGWVGGDGVTPSIVTSDRYFQFPTYAQVMKNGEAVNINDCEVTYLVTASDFTCTAGKNVRGEAVGVWLRYTDERGVYKLDTRFGALAFGTGFYMQAIVNGTGMGTVYPSNGAPFYHETRKCDLPDVPALASGDVIAFKIKCAKDGVNGYVKILLNDKEYGQLVYTGTSLPEVGLGSMNLMAKITDVSLIVNDATGWAECACEEPAVSQYHSDTSCTAGGVWYGTCENCGNKHSKTMTATEHTPDGCWIIDKDATLTEPGSRHQNCLVCGEVALTEEIPSLGGVVESWNLTLSDDLAVNFWVNIQNFNADTAKIVVAVNGDIREYPVASLTAQDDGTYMVTVHVAAAQMNDSITVKIVDGENESVTKEYSVAKYAKAILALDSYSAYHALVKEMLNYGDAAQIYFGYNVDNRIDADLTGAGAAEVDADAAPDMIISGDIDGVSIYGVTLVLRNKIAVRYYFTVTGDVNSYTFTVNGTQYAPVLKDDLYYIEVADINPQNLDDSITLMVNDTPFISYSPMNYIVRMNANGSDNLKALTKAIYNYYLAAEQFTNNNDPKLNMQDEISITDANFVHTYGRMDKEADGLWLEYTASGFSVNFVGKELKLNYAVEESYSANFTPYVTVVVDDESYEEAAYYACPETGVISVETDYGYHTVRVYKRSEGQWSRIKITGVDTDGYFVENRESSERLIEFFGDSITAGYGNRGTESGFRTEDQDGLATYAFLAAQKLDAEASVVAASGKAINLNVWEAELKIPDLLNYSTFTNVAPYAPAKIPQLVVINGGANDATYINQATDSAVRKAREEAFVEAYAKFLIAIAEKYEGTTILCCTNMISEGSVIEPLIQKAIAQAAVENVHVLTLPASQEDGVMGSDGHPAVVSHQKAANVLEEKIRQIMGW